MFGVPRRHGVLNVIAIVVAMMVDADGKMKRPLNAAKTKIEELRKNVERESNQACGESMYYNHMRGIFVCCDEMCILNHEPVTNPHQHSFTRARTHTVPAALRVRRSRRPPLAAARASRWWRSARAPRRSARMRWPRAEREQREQREGQSREQKRAESRVQRAESRVQRAESREQRDTRGM